MVLLRIRSPSLRQAHNVIALTSFLWLFFSRVGFLPLYLQVYSHIALTDKKAENFRAFNLNSVRKKGSVTRTQYFHSKYFPKLFNKNQTDRKRERAATRARQLWIQIWIFSWIHNELICILDDEEDEQAKRRERRWGSDPMPVTPAILYSSFSFFFIHFFIDGKKYRKKKEKGKKKGK